VNIGDLLEEDVPQIKRIHETSHYDYRLPEFVGNPVFPVQRSLYSDGRFVAATLVKLEGEVYLYLDHDWETPQERKRSLELVHKDLIVKCREWGLESIFAVLPPQVEKSFGPRLEEAGWKRDRGWTKYTYELI